MFRNDTQLAMVCDILTRRIRGEPLWRPPVAGKWGTGPTPRAQKLLRAGISNHEMTMLHFAWTLWNGRGMVKRPKGLDALSAGLDGTNLQMIGGLLTAMGTNSASIDNWINTWRTGEQDDRCARLTKVQ